MHHWIFRVLSLGLVACAGFLCLVAPAKAGILLGTPKVTQGGDPFYVYEVPVYLDPGDKMSPATGPNGFNPVVFNKDDYLTIYNILGFQNIVGIFSDPNLQNGLSDFAAIARPSGTGYTPPGQTAPPAQADSADITFYEVPGHNPITNGGIDKLLLGYLAFQSNLPDGVTPTLVLDYTWQDHNNGNLQSGSGSVRVVPEPASLIGLGIGTVMLAGYARVRRSRRQAVAERELC